MKDFHLIYNALEKMDCDSVLATIILVEGSAYKKQGSCMLLLEDGRLVGLLSPGCLEEELKSKAEQVFKTGKSQIIKYDLSEESDLSWGQGYGCNGIIHVLLERIGENEKKVYRLLKALLDKGINVLNVKKLNGQFEQLFIAENGNAFGRWKGPNKVFADFFELMEKEKVKITHLEEEKIVGTKKVMSVSVPVYLQLYEPKRRLYVMGAGKDARPLVSLAAENGFAVTVCDWREELASSLHFPKAESIIIGFPHEVYPQISFNDKDHVIIMSHHFQRDQEWVQLLKENKLKYLGVMGPRDRTRRLLGTSEIPEEIYSPAGLDIGAADETEIAVSIMAEILQSLYKPKKRRNIPLWTVPE